MIFLFKVDNIIVFDIILLRKEDYYESNTNKLFGKKEKRTIKTN